MRFRICVIAFLSVLLGACAVTPPFSEEALRAVDRTLTPEQAVQAAVRDTRVLWGGVIISVDNLPDHTDITALSLPLDKEQRPDFDKPPQNRFIVRYSGYLETMVYAPGREITVLGNVQEAREGKVGDAPYRFPVMKADQIHLWPLREDSRVHFGVGIGVDLHL